MVKEREWSCTEDVVELRDPAAEADKKFLNFLGQ